mmetsp:Transcript_16617/g.22773  ORF Transcript_16617/g.22773 Transcript_16617/m.22773 type:complete len:118 (-) Transcript_16617:157-510(-)
MRANGINFLRSFAGGITDLSLPKKPFFVSPSSGVAAAASDMDTFVNFFAPRTLRFNTLFKGDEEKLILNVVADVGDIFLDIGCICELNDDIICVAALCEVEVKPLLGQNKSAVATPN